MEEKPRRKRPRDEPGCGMTSAGLQEMISRMVSEALSAVRTGGRLSSSTDSAVGFMDGDSDGVSTIGGASATSSGQQQQTPRETAPSISGVSTFSGASATSAGQQQQTPREAASLINGLSTFSGASATSTGQQQQQSPRESAPSISRVSTLIGASATSAGQQQSPREAAPSMSRVSTSIGASATSVGQQQSPREAAPSISEMSTISVASVTSLDEQQQSPREAAPSISGVSTFSGASATSAGQQQQTPREAAPWISSEELTSGAGSASQSTVDMELQLQSDESSEESPIKLEDISLDGLPPATKTRLLSGQELDTSDYSAITQTIFETFVSKGKTFYPERGGYKQVAKSLILRYPNLCRGKAPQDAVEILRLKLVNKFKNTRRRLSSSPALRQERKQKAADSGMPGYSPSPMKETPLKVEAMVSQLRSDPSSEVLHSSLFPERRRRLLSKQGRRSMTELRRDFPVLFTARGMWIEMESITMKTELEEEYNKTFNSILEHMPVEDGGDQLDVLLSALDSPWEKLCDNQVTDGPSLLAADGKYKVQVEGMVCAEVADRKQCIVLLGVACYVFAQKHAPRCRNVMVFLEKAVFGIKQPGLVPSRVRKVLDEVAHKGAGSA